MIGLPNKITEATATTIYYLLYANYGNSTIASSDTNRFKYQLFSIIWQYAPTWEKRLELQDTLRGLTADDLMKGSTQVYNHAYNPSTDPTTQTTTELEYINEQNVTKNKRDPLSAYANLLTLLETDVTKEFVDKFKRLFLTVVQPELPLWYETEIETPSVGLSEAYKGYEGSLYGNYRQITFSDAYGTLEDFLNDFNAQ